VSDTKAREAATERVLPREAELLKDTDYALGRTNAEYDRLIEQAELLRPLTERMLRAAGIGPGMHVLDVGCGVGDVSFLVGSLVGPGGSVVGADLDADVIEVAKQRRIAKGITNVTFCRSDARSVDAGRLFDAAVGRFVLMFMRDPTAALRLIAARVRPGGIVAFHEWDARVTTVLAEDRPVLARFQDLIARTFQRSGASLGIGVELGDRMLDAGLEPAPRPLAEIAVHVGQDDVAYRRWALFARSMLPKMVEYGLATEPEVLDTVDHRLREELHAASGLMPLSWLMIGQWGRKPATP
jgi:2-polyprenyl-3-methyl-5-hydroxy-6-metoxy-1,4-benzoquinol methylase